MAHQRFRKFNTKDMYPDQSLDNDLCMVVRAGNYIFMRGQTGFTLDGEMVGIGDAGAQADNAMKCVKQLLEEAGGKIEHICKITIYLLDPRYRDEVYQVIGKHLKGIYPCSTGLVVQAFARPEMLMEIDVEAVVPDDEPRGRPSESA